MLSNKKRNTIVTELFISGRTLKISLAFITQSYFPVPKKKNLIHYFIMKIPTNFKQIVFNRSSDIDFRGYMNLCDKCTTKPYSFLVTHATLASDNSLRFRKKI